MNNILVVDDHPFFLHGFSQYLGEHSDFEVETALSVDEAIARAGDDGFAAAPYLAQEAVSGGPFVDAGGKVLDGSGVGVASGSSMSPPSS